jgi:hypothetical protein
MKKRQILGIFVLFALAAPNFFGAIAQADPDVRNIVFPVIGRVTYYDDFGAPRSGHTHEGQDLMGTKMLPLVAAVTGTVRSVVYPQATWGYSVTIQDSDGYTYHYLHMNNDIPGTDNGQGDGMNVYAPDIRPGNKVVAGQLIGYMGDSGNAETTTAHLHFEVRRPDRTPVSPFRSLQAATKVLTPVPAPQVSGEILPYGSYDGGAFVAAGNVDADNDPEIITGAGPGGGPHVVISNTDGTVAGSFFAYENFNGGVDVAAGDIDGDGRAEVITAPFSRGGPNVKVFKADGTLLSNFMAYDSRFTGGLNITAADVNNDGKAEIITAPNKGGGSHVKVFRSDGTVLNEFFAYEGFTGGVDVAAYSMTANNPAYIVTAPNTGGGPHVKVFDSTGVMRHEFMAYDPMHRGGVRVSMANVKLNDTEPEILTAPLLGGPDFRLFDLNGATHESENEYEVWWNGKWDAAAYNGRAFSSVGIQTPGLRTRRASVRELEFQSSSFPGFPDNDDGDIDWRQWRRNRNRDSAD